MKKHILVPIALLIYLGVMAYFFYPGKTDGSVSFTQYYITIGITAVIIVALSFFLKKKAENNEKYKKDK
ncbi:MAG: hypothetical protein LBH12_02675 [Dysgonamonadaceae bacterium]|jgi:hypothetical protein|nr:hypothetical protein [Dysgonamonadaceae bacterium]